GPGKKLVRREVVRVITPGTATDLAVLDIRENNFLAAVARHPSGSPIGLAFVDLSTGEFQATEFSGARADEALRDELQLLRPRETLLPRPQQLFETSKTSLLEGTGGVESRLEDWVFQYDYAERILREQFGVAELTGFGLDTHPQAIAAAGAIIHYLRENAARRGAVTPLLQQPVVRGEIRKALRGILDLERLTSRITLGLATPRELLALRKSIAQLPVLKNFVTPPPTDGSDLLRRLHEEIDELADVRDRLERSIAEEPPALSSDPGIIRAGYHAELDELRNLSQHSKQIIASKEPR